MEDKNLERREFDVYFNKMVSMIELNSTGQEKFSSHIATLTKTIENSIKEIENNEALLREILDKMKITSNETLNIELQKIKDLNLQLQMNLSNLLKEFKDFCDEEDGPIIKNSLSDISSKISSMSEKIKVIEEKDKKLDLFMKLVGIGLTLFAAVLIIFTNVTQSNNMDKIENAIQQINKHPEQKEKIEHNHVFDKK